MAKLIDDMGIMNMETYERTIPKAEVCQKLLEAEAEVAEGRAMDGKSVFDRLRARYEG